MKECCAKLEKAEAAIAAEEAAELDEARGAAGAMEEDGEEEDEEEVVGERATPPAGRARVKAPTSAECVGYSEDEGGSGGARVGPRPSGSPRRLASGAVLSVKVETGWAFGGDGAGGAADAAAPMPPTPTRRLSLADANADDGGGAARARDVDDGRVGTAWLEEKLGAGPGVAPDDADFGLGVHVDEEGGHVEGLAQTYDGEGMARGHVEGVYDDDVMSGGIGEGWSEAIETWLPPRWV